MPHCVECNSERIYREIYGQTWSEKVQDWVTNTKPGTVVYYCDECSRVYPTIKMEREYAN